MANSNIQKVLGGITMGEASKLCERASLTEVNPDLFSDADALATAREEWELAAFRDLFDFVQGRGDYAEPGS